MSFYFQPNQNVITQHEQPDHYWMHPLLHLGDCVGVGFTYYQYRSISLHLYSKSVDGNVGLHS